MAGTLSSLVASNVGEAVQKGIGVDEGVCLCGFEAAEQARDSRVAQKASTNRSDQLQMFSLRSKKVPGDGHFDSWWQRTILRLI